MTQTENSPTPPADLAPSTWWLYLPVFLGLWICFVVGAVALGGTGFIHPETHSFLPHYLSGRPFWELVFDNRITEWGNYQARELAFVVDYFDCQCIAWCAVHGHPHLFAASHYLLLLVSGFALWRICAAHLRLGHPVALGFALLLWTAPTALFYTSFYRSAKVAVLTASLCTIWAWFSIANARHGSRPAPFWKYPLFALCAFCMPMLDKMGLAFLCMLCAFLACNWWRSRSRTDAGLLAMGAVAFVAAIVHGWWAGPALTLALNHYRAGTEYSSLPLGEMAAAPARLGRVIVAGALFTVDSFRFVLGNLPAGLALAVGYGVWRSLPRDGAQAGPLRRFTSPAWVFVIGVLAIFGLYVVMLLRFESMLSNEHRRVFYSYPVAGLWLVLVAVAAHEAVNRYGANGMRFVRISVLLCVIGALYAAQEHRFMMRHGKYEPYYANAANCVAALRPAALANSGLTREEAARLLATSPLPGDGLITDIRQDRVYLALAAKCAPR